MTSVIDSRNGTTTYNYNTTKGLLNSVTDANGNTTTYTYDANTDALLSTNGNANATTSVTSSYSYSNDRLSSITHNGFSYGFNYDTFGRLTSTSVAGQSLISHTYSSDGNLSSSAYGNGDTVSYTYDDLDRVTSNSYNGVKTYEYFYNKEGLLAKEKDNENSVTTDYEYDFARRLSASTSSNGVKANYTYDERNNIKSLKMKKNGETLSNTDFEYTTDGLLSYVSWSTLGSAYRIHSYDSLNRPTKKSMYLFAPLYAHYGEINYYHTYLSNGTNETGLISQIKYTRYFEDHYFLGYGEFDVRTLDYTYDANGNIKTVTTDGVLTDSYTYDGLNQLVRHDNSAAGKSYVYSYDAGGNITSKKEYAYTTGTLGTVLSTKSYAYDSVWKDKLVSYDGKAITYDAIGNPLTYDGYTFSWQKGRQLASIDGNGVSLDFKYNSDGLRTKKISSDKTIEYYYSGDVLIAQYDGTEWIKFCYSADGEIVGFSYDNDPYYFIKNAQGDIIGILDRSAEVVCTYEYDAWGNCTVYGSSGSINTSSTFIGNINPIRYRGYYYDAETSLYYVSSRYYEPEFGRFLNSDTSDVITASVGNPGYDKNLYAYCDNNPVIRIDVTGYIWETVFDIASLGVSVVEVAINPSDPWAWAGLVGDAIDLIPFVTGVGETTKAVRLVKHTDNILDTFKATKKSAKSSVGVYEITYKSGKNYVGKGSIGRAAQSAKRYSRPNVMNNMRGDTITSIRWKASSSSRNAFIEEFALQTQKGVGNKYTYNKIWSPGRKYYTAMGGRLR